MVRSQLLDDRQTLRKRWRLDGRRKPVPLWLKEAFIGRQWLLRWCGRLDQLVAEMERHSAQAKYDAARWNIPHMDWSKHLDVPSICSQLKATLRTIQSNMPFCRCPKKDSDSNCMVCGGNGWITSTRLVEHRENARK